MLDVEQCLRLPGNGEKVLLARADFASYVAGHTVEVLDDSMGLGEGDRLPPIDLDVADCVPGLDVPNWDSCSVQLLRLGRVSSVRPHDAASQARLPVGVVPKPGWGVRIRQDRVAHHHVPSHEREVLAPAAVQAAPQGDEAPVGRGHREEAEHVV